MAGAINDELKRQQDQIEMIASENIVSTSVMEAQGSILTNKYAEVIQVGAIMVVASMSMSLKLWRLNVPKSFSTAILLMCSRIRAHRLIKLYF